MLTHHVERFEAQSILLCSDIGDLGDNISFCVHNPFLQNGPKHTLAGYALHFGAAS